MKPKVIELLEQIKLFPGMKEKKEVLSEGCYVEFERPYEYGGGNHIGYMYFGDYLIKNNKISSGYISVTCKTTTAHKVKKDRLLKILGHLPTYMDLLVCLGDYVMGDDSIIDRDQFVHIELVQGDELHEQPNEILDEIIILLKEQLVGQKQENK